MMIVYADGACHMGIGASVQTADGGEIDTVSAFLGDGTNNMAEYHAAIAGVRKAIEVGTIKPLG